MIRPLVFSVLLTASLSAQWGADSQAPRNTSHHQKRIIGYVTQWDAWKGTSAGLPKQGFLNHLNLDYSQYTHLNFSFFGVANDGSLHSGDYRNPNIWQLGTVQNPAPLFHGDIYSSWDLYLLWGELNPQWSFTPQVVAAGFESHAGGWRHVPSGLTGPMPVPYKPPGNAPGILELAHSKGVKVMASIGGWSMCRHFPEMAAAPVKRARFIADCQKLIALGFDGIDLDWEYPGPFAGMNFTGSAADFANFLTLITELRAAIGPDKEITSAMSADPAKLAGFDWPAVSAILDSVNLMTYDFEGGWSDQASHNARLFPAPGQESTTFSCKRTVDFLTGQGVPAGKLALGLAFYGRGVVCNGPAALGAPTVKVAKTIQPDGPVVTAADFASWEPFDATPTYQRISQLIGDGWKRHWDDVAKVPYLTKGSSFLSYDDSRSIGEKVKFARDRGLGGVIIWTAYGDLRAGALSTTTSKLAFSPATDAPLVNVVNSVFAGDPIPADATEGPAPAGGPRFGLDALPARPLVAGYLNALRGPVGQEQVVTDVPAAVAAANLEAFDIIISAFAEPLPDGSLGTGLGAFSSYLPAVVAEGHTLGKSVVVSVGGAYPASLASAFATIAASPTLRQTFSNNIVAFMEEHDLDGIDIDYEFPADAGAARTDFTLLMQTIHQTVKAADPRYIVMFGTGPGWYLGGFDFAALKDHCDFFFYFGYDWKNPANGPMTKPGSVQWTNANDTLPEASVKGGIDYVLGKGFPAGKIICGLPFYGSNNRSWSAVRHLYVVNPAGFDAAIDPHSLEVRIDGEWFTTPAAMKRKMDALLDPARSVLANAAVIRGVGCWEIGHEHASHPDLSSAFSQWFTNDPSDPPGPPPSPNDGWTRHALPPPVSSALTLQTSSTWGTGFEGILRFTNQTGAALATWTIHFDAPFVITSTWNGVYGAKSGATLTITNPTWGGYSLAAGATAEIGIVATGTPVQPSNFRLNGQAIGGEESPPLVTFTTWSGSHNSGPATADPDGDGRPNLVEFLNGSLPKTADTGHRVERRAINTDGGSAEYFCIIIPANRTAADVEYRVISAPTPDFASPRLMVLHETLDLGNNRLEAVWRDTTPMTNRPRAFARVEARVVIP
jgi:GH18 family chitinase